ncbi:MAG TPA: hypothetical protein VJP07_08205 [Dehalococcoidia bacterium]|nr:hypothetical protein [Dehalococcoidia bacterium]
MANRDLRHELIADVEQIEDNARLFLAGRNSAYQAVAIQLRNLLLKGPRGLMLRVFPGATLHPLSAEPGREEGADGLIRVTLLGHADLVLRPTPHVQLPVQYDAEPIPISQWIGQWVIDSQIRIDKLINETADQEVAHTQEERTRMLERLNSAGFYFGISDPNDIGNRRPDRYMYQMMIVAIGEYVAKRCRQLLAATPVPDPADSK